MASETSTANLNPTFFDKVISFAAPISQNIRERISAFMQATQEKPKPAPKPFLRTQLSFNGMQADLRPVASKMVLLRMVLSKLFKIPQVEMLINRAFEGKPFTLSFVEHRDLFSEGECNFAKQQINIRKDLNLTNIVSTLVYELCNASNTELKNVLAKRYENEHDYAQAIESAEYLTYQNHISLLTTLLNDQEFISTLDGVGENIDELRSEVNDAYQTFEAYWQGANKANENNGISHSEYYRSHFRKVSARPNESVTARPSITPAFSLKTNHDPLAVLFHGPEAKELYQEISKNQQAIAMLKRFPAPVAASLAKNTTKRNLQGFMALNTTEQVVFISQYMQCKMKNYQTVTSSQSNAPRAKP